MERDLSARPLALGAALATIALLLTSAASADAKAAFGRATFVARGSVDQVDVTGAQPGEQLRLLDRRGNRLGSGRADSLGALLFRRLAPGPGYRVQHVVSGGGTRSGPLTVLPDRSAPPSTSIYGQQIPAGGYGYLTTRDGTELAIDVRLPGPASKGPYPTLVEYAGYGYANPAGAESGISAVATLLGFAVVDVNIRGTGCSGGAFDYFEPLQSLDGYDVVETVARQPWVLHHKVGMAASPTGGSASCSWPPPRRPAWRRSLRSR